jgi:SAM-dependent methyltransferase
MYETIARYYDLFHASLTADITFVIEQARRAGGAALELGSGSGRLLLPLARAGVHVTGLDNSPAMMALARARLAATPANIAARVSLVEGDMAHFALDRRFAFIFVAYNTLHHLPPEGVRATLRRVATHLEPGGRFFLDLANPFVLAQTPNDRLLSLEGVAKDPTSGDLVAQLASNWVDDHEQQLSITWIYDITPAGGGPVYRMVVQTTHHYLYPHELVMALELAGLRLEAMFGHYDSSPFTEESERLLLLGVKPASADEPRAAEAAP